MKNNFFDIGVEHFQNISGDTDDMYNKKCGENTVDDSDILYPDSHIAKSVSPLLQLSIAKKHGLTKSALQDLLVNLALQETESVCRFSVSIKDIFPNERLL